MRPRAVILILFALLSLALLHLNTEDSFEFAMQKESGYFLNAYGWPFPFHFKTNPIVGMYPLETSRTHLRWFLLNLPCWFVLAVLPPYFFERLLRRTLHIHLTTALVLSLAAAALLALNLIPHDNFNSGYTDSIFLRYGTPYVFCIARTDIPGFEGTHWNIPAAFGNAILALTFLCTVALLTERILVRKPNLPPPPSGPAGPP